MYHVSRYLNSLKNWILFNLKLFLIFFLYLQGHKELTHIAKNYKERFPKLLAPPYSDKKFNIKYTVTNRTRDSFIAVFDAILGQKERKKIINPQANRSESIKIKVNIVHN